MTDPHTDFRTSGGWDRATIIFVSLYAVGFTAAIVLPDWIGASAKSHNASLKGAMRTVQIAAESYATDSGGRYGNSLEVLAAYLPGGNNSLTNPKPGKLDPSIRLVYLDWRKICPNAVQGARACASPVPASPATIYYSCSDDGTSYAVATDVSNGTGCLVLSNQ